VPPYAPPPVEEGTTLWGSGGLVCGYHQVQPLERPRRPPPSVLATAMARSEERSLEMKVREGGR
jgi:hypothetical protein